MWRDTTTACGISGRIQYRPHNADRSERRLLNVLPRTEKPSPPRGRCRRSRRMRCRLRLRNRLPAKSNFKLSNALSRYTSSPPAGAAVSLRLGQARFSVSPGDRFIAAPLLRSPQRGSQSKGRAARFDKRAVFARIPKLSPLCTLPLSVTAPGLPVPRGGLGGRSRIEFIMWPPLSAAT